MWGMQSRENEVVNMSLIDFVQQMLQNPMLLVSTLLTLGVILVNGWTDAPNAIATCVSTRAIGVRKAIVMAAIFNFLGVFVMTSINASVAMTIYNMVDFGGDAQASLIALCAAMAAIVLWATAAWYFGIPTSESHALIAGLSGAAVAIQNNFSGINGSEWVKVLYGLLLSTLQSHPELASNIQVSTPECDFDRCTACGECVKKCPTHATDLLGSGRFVVEPASVHHHDGYLGCYVATSDNTVPVSVKLALPPQHIHPVVAVHGDLGVETAGDIHQIITAER